MAIETTQPRVYARGEKRPRSEFQLLMFAVIMLLHVAAIGALVWHLATWTLPSIPILAVAVAMYSISMLGVTTSYHRGLTHGGYKCGPWLRAILGSAAGLAFQGAAIGWIRDHLAHHAHTDKPGDPHSPKQYAGLKGILWAHIGWLWYARQSPAAPPRIEKDRFLLWQQKYYWVYIVASLAIPTIVGGCWGGGVSGAVDGLFVAGFLRIVVALNIGWCVNSICHLYGRQVTVTLVQADSSGGHVVVVQSDGSRNNRWLALPTFGEAYHALHHLFSAIAFHGWNWWNLDPTKWLLLILEKCGLIHELKKPPPFTKITTAKTTDLRLAPDSFLRDSEPATV